LPEKNTSLVSKTNFYLRKMSSHALLQKTLIKQCVRTCLLKNNSQTVLQIWDIGN